MQNRVKQVIESKAFTPSRFADHIGVPRATISHILSGRNKPSLEVVQKILDAFPDISAEWLVKGKGSLVNSAPSLFDPDESTENEDTLKAGSTKVKEVIVESGKIEKSSEAKDGKDFMPPADNSDNDSLGEKPITKHGPSAVHKAKKSVKIIVMYADGTYSEHLPSV